MKVADEKHDGFLDALVQVDLAIAERKSDAWGTGDVECPICHDRIDYRFKRGRRMLLRMKCRTSGCVVAMS